MLQLEVWLDRDLVGVLSHDGATNRFSFEYTAPWREQRRSFPIAPRLPLARDKTQSDEAHSAEVRQFFENLLPEGEALDHAAQANGIAKSNLIGLVLALGKETSGAIRVVVPRPETADSHRDPGDEAQAMRLVTPQQLSERIRARAQMPFSVWDGKVRLSIAGYQDKIAVYERDDAWYLVDGPQLASTVIVKPAPVRAELVSLPANEHMCMQLAQRAGLEVPKTRLAHVPEPVLLVSRFDRFETAGRVHRLHVIDGCQALGLAVSMKYERPYGDGPDVRNIRDGATHAKLFGLLEQSPQPARDKRALLRWVIFQTLIGNTDAHGKNISFFCGLDGLRLAPAYDLVCMPALGNTGLASTCAMAVGDAFTEQDLSPFEWASFAQQCGLPLRLVSQELQRLSIRVMDSLHDVVDNVLADGVPQATAQRIAEVVSRQGERWIQLGPAVMKMRRRDLE
jgi:serine/threonine-protein kinase HipA